MVSGAPECESFEFTHREHDGQGRFAQERVIYSRGQIQEIGATRRAEVLLLQLEMPAKSYSRSGWLRRRRYSRTWLDSGWK